MSMIDGSANPASASFMVIIPVNGIATITNSATASMRGRLMTNITMAAAGSSPDEASAAAGRYMADVKHVVVSPA